MLRHAATRCSPRRNALQHTVYPRVGRGTIGVLRRYLHMMNSPDYAYDGSREWSGLVRKVARAAPEYNT